MRQYWHRQVQEPTYVEKRAEYSGENGVVLRATHITSAEKPEEELVYF